MDPPKAPAPQRAAAPLSSPASLWAAAGAAALLLTACFAARCAVTRRAEQLCGEQGPRPRDDLTALSCYNDDGSGSVQTCCPLRWVYFRSNCYFFSTNTLTWALSVRNCSGMGAQLVTIDSREEQEFLFHAKPRGREFYIGLTDQKIESQWQWVDGRPLNPALSFWDAGEPNNLATVEDCVTIRDAPSPRQNWNDVPCFLNMFRVCEMPQAAVLQKESRLDQKQS
ncbi:C-type lectin domain family 4 member E [Galemys pyrenaicus]|uniref:C-type lectin domain family 4 member E n=1 Tax=Galemys pyrenaicus TaxID=202257 RepID=A0A8J6AYR9_GALPY|nr:C-type lectin domain family 4 member E [Galemys pyrenaicus]KAG8525117.1 C-type lectin domain family 4 member E [Galemys pyrenaicus]